ncbi:MAG: cardiolipin synthase [Zymomonas mobilis subsp. pomaceae]|uniref:Cardiolipin synthase n=1 Tax=Zymomonas mobilis subsp. pomaceae (strain ATCC 29192 / DSM 22645 / JCM 10191 / CCUG 17912 / NBRC 13757 / NCIMB 11200 / NRRL B-4491 / Barker I) TaxID=579138 RepID=F8ESJ8_ZYMMT|nr:cardiolipin synthase [Zymomonas mobilis]AEI37773.1 phospholipase D/Transphosphatidylase [Zymomonas mobilis subsp. pomaceae ATCC 29192]MDX5949140.1 cardiolipin synthase [Zymomonas mobilis subsp. pomaceae]GEB88947.1 cardiolipin synthase A [Zymomonas mobilis subsp. pomaceae]
MTFGSLVELLAWGIRLVMLVVVPMRRTPQAASSWLLLIFFQPALGLLLYLLIGQARFPSWRAERFAKLKPFLEEQRAKLKDTVALLPSSSENAASLAERLGHMPALKGNRMLYISDYQALFDHLVTDIDQAQNHVHLVIYIFDTDKSGQQIIAALGRAAARGVNCQVLIDALGSRRSGKQVIERLKALNVEAREALPFRLLRGRTRGDMRNHRKLFIIDGKIGYAGSQNIINRDWRPNVINQELTIRVEGPIVFEMETLFAINWYLESGELPHKMRSIPHIIPPEEGPHILQLLPSGADYSLAGFETMLVSGIYVAREKVVIVTPYLIPDSDLLVALKTAALRGVTVNIIVSKIADQLLVSLAQKSYYQELLNAGIHIHRYRDKLLHAKHISVDKRLAMVGSSNVDIRSFLLNEEVSLILYDEDAISQLRDIEIDYLKNSDELDKNAWRRRPRHHKIMENLARLVSPLL